MMNVLSVICMLLLIPYLMAALVFTPKREGRHLFRMVYSAAAIGLLCGVFYFVFESIMSDFSAYIDPSENVMRNAYAYLMLLLPVNIGLILTNLCLKKKKPVLFLSIASALSVAAAAAGIINSYVVDGSYANSASTLLEFAVLYVPFLFYFAVSGLIGTEKRWERVLQNIAMYLNLAVMIGYLIVVGISEYAIFADAGLASVLPLLPLIIIWILIPVIPIIVYNHFRTKDAIRNGETLPGKLRIRKRQKKTRDDKKTNAVSRNRNGSSGADTENPRDQ